MCQLWLLMMVCIILGFDIQEILVKKTHLVIFFLIETEKYTISLIFKLSDILSFVQQEQKQNYKRNVWNLDRNEIFNSHYTSQIGCSGDRSPSRCRCRWSCRESQQPKSFHLKTQAAAQDNKVCLLHELIFFWLLYCLSFMVSYKTCAESVLDEPDIFDSTVNKVERRILEGFRHQDKRNMILSLPD